MLPSVAGRAVVLGVALLAAGCATNGTTAANGRTKLTPIAFESITGAPQPVFNRLVENIGREAENQRVLIVSRQDQAGYRVRGYLSAASDGGQGRIAWVFDVFDSSKRRAVRLAGEEPAAGGGDVWGAASDGVLARIAARGVGGLAEFLAGAEGPEEGASVADLAAAETPAAESAGFAAAR